MEIQITTLMENNPDDKKQLCYEHGLSLLIEADGKRILFDTGQSGNFMKNAKALNESLNNLDAVILSHGHYDHTGGFQKLAEETKQIPLLIVGKEFFQPKFKKTDSGYEFKGNSFDEAYLQEQGICYEKLGDDLKTLSEHVFLFHHYERKNDFEKPNAAFFLKTEESYIPDDFEDEICLGIKTKKGLVVIVACSHAGIVNMLDTISERVKMPIYGVIGGTHLVNADEERIQKTIDALKAKKITFMAFCHCTGEKGMKWFQKEWKENFVFNNTGRMIEI